MEMSLAKTDFSTGVFDGFKTSFSTSTSTSPFESLVNP